MAKLGPGLCGIDRCLILLPVCLYLFGRILLIILVLFFKVTVMIIIFCNLYILILVLYIA